MGFNLYSYSENNPVTYKIKNKNTEYTSATEANYSYNQKLSQGVNGYIYNQHEGIASKLRYGLNTTARDGCGWVATYNALIMLGNRMEPYEVIHEYEKQGVLFYGLFGTNPSAVVRFFKARGYNVSVIYNYENYAAYNNDITFEEQLKTNLKNSRTNILFYTASFGGHYISLKYDKEKYRYACYNVNCDRLEPHYVDDADVNDDGVGDGDIKSILPGSSTIRFAISIS